MKTYINYLIGAALVIFIQSCDKIEPPYRESTGGVTGANDTVIINGDTIFFDTDLTPAVKKVLAEDYTGHLCGNCPYAGILLNDTLKNIFGEQLVVISPHAGWFASYCPAPGASPCPTAAPPGSFATDFTNPTSIDWDNFFGISAAGNPNGMINRKGYPSSHIKGQSQWQAQIQTEAALPPDFKLRIINHYNPGTRELRTAVRSEFLNAMTDTIKLEVVLTEDSLVDWQEWYLPGPVTFYDSSYVHHHVLRGGINGSFGTVIASGTITSGIVKLNGYAFTLNANWDASRCKVVAFVYDAGNYKVLQVEEADVIQ